jgi:hypothetical protein
VEVEIEGGVIRCTPKHPFYVKKGVGSLFCIKKGIKKGVGSLFWTIKTAIRGWQFPERALRVKSASWYFFI